MQAIFAFLLSSLHPNPIPAIIIVDALRVEPAQTKKICRPGAVTGTRVSGKICKSQAEWEAHVSRTFNKSDAFRNQGLSGISR
jgi:hypothetical protein